MAAKSKRRWLPSRRILLLLGFLVKVLHADIASRCSEECSNVLTDDSVIDRDISCNQTCKINSCSTGCGLWDNTTLATCNIACNTSFNLQQFKVQYCQSGCVYAEDVYAEEVIGAVGDPSAPRIEDDSIEATSVSIDWNEASHPNVKYILQWRYVNIGNGAWVSFHTQPISVPFTTVPNLKPYTTYEFRIQWVITSRHVLSSPESRQVTTDAQGVPASEPIITSLLSPSSSTISVTWQPPRFPSGQLVGYTLSIQGPGEGPKRQDIPDTRYSHTFVHLSASTEYTVTLEARNMNGAGPPAEGTVTTLAEPDVTSTKPYIVAGATSFNFDSGQEESTVSFVELDKLTETPLPEDIHIVEHDNHTIQDVGVHYWKNLVIFSDTAGTIHKREIDVNNFLSGFETSSEILYQSMGGRIPTVVDVDWLFDQIYFVEENQILRCDLNCTEVEIAVDGLVTALTDVKVDPYHGYLYWSQLGTGQGIYRIDLADIGADSPPSPQPVIQEDTIKSFVVDSMAYELFYSNELSFSIDGAFLDGTAASSFLEADRTIRHADFVNVTGLVYYSQQFTWTRHTEEIQTCFFGNESSYTRDNMYVQTGQTVYQESDVFVCPEAFHGLDVFHPSYQPYPMPTSAPGNLQALFVDTAAELIWTEAPQLDALGRGAWREWRYRIELTNPDSGDVLPVDGEAAEAIRVTGLEPGTQYSVRVRGYSTGGDGPWSETFDGTTLKSVDVPPFLMFASDTGIMKVDLDGNNMGALVNDQPGIKDIDWYGDLVLWIDSNGNIFQANMANPTEVAQLPLPQNAESLAVDWLGGVLYWGDLKQHKIFRIGLTSESDSSAEHAYLSDAQDLAIDAVNAYMYWTTSQSVERARLNGLQYFEYVRTADFSGDRIAGLTLDLDDGAVYWFVLSFVVGTQQLKLYRADMAGYSSNPVSTVEEIGVVDSITEKPALHHYSQKLFWINKINEVIISDMAGENLATLPTDAAHALSIVQKTLHPLPTGFTSPPNVIPSTISLDSVTITGVWDDFIINWDASVEVSYGTVLYEISVLASDGKTFSYILSEPGYSIQTLLPYTDLQISLMSYTYWAYTESITVQKRSPESVPSIPLNFRVFILEDKDIMSGNSTFSADLRWEAVEETNGVLLGYKVYLGMSTDDLKMVEVGPDVTQHTLEGLVADSTYSFKVEGFTKVGSGIATTIIEASTAASSPPPTLLTLSPSGASQRDVDTQESMALLGGATVDAVAMVFSSEDEMLYWLDAVDKKLKRSPLYEDKIEDLADIESVGDLGPSSLAINWVTKQLYWPEGNALYMFDTTQSAKKVKMVGIDDGSKVIGVGVNPLQSALFWTEEDQSATTTIMTSDLTGQGKRPLFGGVGRRRRQSCTCTDVTPGSLIVVDLSDSENGMIYFVDGDGSGDVWAADLDGCQCQRVVDAASLMESGLPPDSLSVDSKRLYWTNEAQSIVGSVNKSSGGDFQSQSADGASFVIAFGDNLQPYPDPSCLVPQNYNQSAQLVDSSSESLSLTFDPATSPPECTGISLATPMYTVYHKINGTSDELQEKTPALSINLTGLEPYSYYSIEVSVANFYSTGNQPHGPAVVYRTDEGIPSKARDLAIQILTPSTVNASWTEPANPNGHPDSIRYRIRYSPEDGSEMRYTDFSNVQRISDNRFAITFDGLIADTLYEFWVLSYPQSGNEFRESDIVMATTFANPAPVEMIASTDVTLTVTWMSPMDLSVRNHAIEYAEAGLISDGNPDRPDGAEWIVALKGDTVNNTLYDITLGENGNGLRPYAYYHVRTQVTYQSGWKYEYNTNDEIIKTFKTKAGFPGSMLPPGIEEIDAKQESYKVTWRAPAANGPGKLTYILQATKIDTVSWFRVYKGTELSWKVNLTAEETYRFRVAAVSEIGQGEYSTASDDHYVTQPPPAGGLDMTIIYAAVAGVVLLIIVIILAIVFVSRSKAANKRKMENSLQVHFSPDHELAQLRNMPTSVVNRDNTLYAVTTTANGSEVELPIFPRERLKLVTFLGSGAFGEVFEGLATDIEGPGTGDTRVAVKTLRKGATDEEKDEFLKEAALMGNFQHKNILGLLGVCLDNDPQFILLELMEGGDLLTYLRGARATSATAVRLSPMDLTEIILDVANGCKYLESLKFVHRDLAARNCLVNIKDYAGPDIERCVKIGDFGLARDIYKSDYYRKEGEGLLPVRWMSPEALVDGVFSVQSDVWAFGILTWEVMTLGQQPYPARNNLDVLQYVTAGGRLGRPDNCPDDIHDIMIKCWEQTAAGRPSFRNIVERLESYRRNSNVGGIDNQGFENSAAMNVKYTKLQDPAMQEYLLPMNSAQSLSDPTVPGARSRPPDINIVPDDDIGQQKAANRGQDVRRKKKDGGSQRRQSPAPRRQALDEAVENLHSPGPRDREKGLEPRYHAFPPKGSWSKAAGAKKRRAAPPIPDEGPPLDPPGRPKSQHGPMIDPEEAAGRSRGGVVTAAAAARADDPPPAIKPRRHPNPFRKNSFDENEKRQYVNLPDDSQVNAFANV